MTEFWNREAVTGDQPPAEPSGEYAGAGFSPRVDDSNHFERSREAAGLVFTIERRRKPRRSSKSPPVGRRRSIFAALRQFFAERD